MDIQNYPKLILTKEVYLNSMVNVSFLLIPILFFNEALDSFFRLNFFGFLDEAFLLCALIFLIINALMENKLNFKSFLVFCSLFYFIGISLSFGLDRNLAKIVAQSLIHLKFFVFYIFFDKILSKRQISHSKKLKKVFKFILILGLSGLVLELLFENLFYEIFNIDERVRPINRRAKNVYGGFVNANNLSLLLFSCFFLWLYERVNKISMSMIYVIAFLCALFIVFLGSRTSLLGVFLPVFFLVKEKILKPRILLGFLFISILGFLYLYNFTEFIERTTDNLSSSLSFDTKYVRGLMIYLSILLFWHYFPIGSGAGTFGTVMSKNSVVYSDLGVAHRTPFINFEGVYDSNWAAILGEFGIVGLLIFFLLLRTIFKIGNPDLSSSRLHLRTSLLFLIIIFSFTNPVFMNSKPAILFSLLIIGMSLIDKVDADFQKNSSIK